MSRLCSIDLVGYRGQVVEGCWWMGGRKLRLVCQQWGVRSLSVNLAAVQVQRVLLLRDMWEEQRWRLVESNRVQGRRPGLDCTQNGQIRRQERAGRGRVNRGQPVVGYCYSRKTSLIHRISGPPRKQTRSLRTLHWRLVSSKLRLFLQFGLSFMWELSGGSQDL